MTSCAPSTLSRFRLAAVVIVTRYAVRYGKRGTVRIALGTPSKLIPVAIGIDWKNFRIHPKITYPSDWGAIGNEVIGLTVDAAYLDAAYLVIMLMTSRASGTQSMESSSTGSKRKSNDICWE
ncbi:hypothetical protein LXL04_004411 [Taraxacum kok-saghyz]